MLNFFVVSFFEKNAHGNGNYQHRSNSGNPIWPVALFAKSCRLSDVLVADLLHSLT
jgi:hypothetical protein